MATKAKPASSVGGKSKLPGKIKIGEFRTPVGVSVYPHLTTPDTKWKKEGEFRTKLRYDEATAEGIRETLDQFLDKAFETYKELLAEANPKKLKTVTKAALPIKQEEDEDGNELDTYLLNTKRVASGVSQKTGKVWKAKIVFADSKGKPVPTKDLSIWGGSELAVYGQVMAWYNAKDNEIGISVEIAGVQIKKLVAGGAANVEFEEMEGDGFDVSSIEDDADPASKNDGDDGETEDDSPDF